MYIVIGAAAFMLGLVIAAVIIVAANKASNARRHKRRGQPEKKKRKVEFSKLVLALVLFTYFLAVAVGVRLSFIDFTQYSTLAMLVGAPTAAAIGFYAWKAKAENIVKIKKDNPEETEGVPVDLNNIQP